MAPLLWAKGRELSSLTEAGDGGGRGGSIEIYSRRVLKRICAFGERDFAFGSRREQSPLSGRSRLSSRPRQRPAIGESDFRLSVGEGRGRWGIGMHEG